MQRSVITAVTASAGCYLSLCSVICFTSVVRRSSRVPPRSSSLIEFVEQKVLIKTSSSFPNSASPASKNCEQYMISVLAYLLKPLFLNKFFKKRRVDDMVEPRMSEFKKTDTLLMFVLQSNPKFNPRNTCAAWPRGPSRSKNLKRSPKEIIRINKGNKVRRNRIQITPSEILPTTIYTALMEDLIADEDAIDKEVTVRLKTSQEESCDRIKKFCKADLEDVDSEHFDRDDNTGDDNEETKPDPEEIYNIDSHSFYQISPCQESFITTFTTTYDTTAAAVHEPVRAISSLSISNMFLNLLIFDDVAPGGVTFIWLAARGPGGFWRVVLGGGEGSLGGFKFEWGVCGGFVGEVRLVEGGVGLWAIIADTGVGSGGSEGGGLGEGGSIKDEPGKTTMETEVESMVTVPIQQVSSSVPLLILQSSISHLLNQYLLPVKNHSLQLSPPTSALQQSSSVLEMYYNLPPRTVSPDPVAIVASRAVDPVGSPSSTTIDQDEQSTSTSPTNQEIQSQVTHQGPVPQFMAPDHSSSGPVLHEMTSDQIRSDLTPNRQETSVDNISSDLVSNKQKASDYDISGPVPPRKNVVSLADKTDSSQKEIEFLFNHFFEEYFSWNFYSIISLKNISLQ
ncbi:hypothetical protein Tco_1406670 [Tanacetum coccineum]